MKFLRTIPDGARDEAWRRLTSDAVTRDLLKTVLQHDFTERAISTINEADKGEVNLLRGEGRLLMEYLDKLGG